MTSLESYMREVCSRPILSDVDEMDLARRYAETRDPLARDQLVAANLRLVVQVARGFTKNLSILADLIQEGTLGLFDALGKFDRQRGYKFSTYAVYFVRGKMVQFLSENSGQVQLDDDECNPIILQDSEECHSPATLLEQAQDDHVKTRIQELLSYFEQTLSSRDREIFKSLWRSEQRTTLMELSRIHGLTKPRIHQIHKEILSQLKTFLGNRMSSAELMAC